MSVFAIVVISLWPPRNVTWCSLKARIFIRYATAQSLTPSFRRSGRTIPPWNPNGRCPYNSCVEVNMREVSHDGMPYCKTHHRLFPHPFVGWLTPHGVQGLALLDSRCDVCHREQGDDVLRSTCPVVSSRAT